VLTPKDRSPLPVSVPEREPESLAFMQSFIVELMNIVDQQQDKAGRNGGADTVEQIGLTAGSCLEEMARRSLGHDEAPLSVADYADLIVALKNRIGGAFVVEDVDADTVRVVSSRCPFGERVKAAPNLCHMTSSVFGGIAARNFGYAKVELSQRIALGHAGCEVMVHLNARQAAEVNGTEYFLETDNVRSNALARSVATKLDQRIRERWCEGSAPTGGRSVPAIVAESQSMRDALHAMQVVAPTDATVLLTGETGCGKELMARALHTLSNRWRGPLVIVNCGAIPENLIESVLFGHEKGAFTGASGQHHGYFQRAEKGTLFLDEIDSIPLLAQAKLLRVLQEGEYERVGGKRTLMADVRIIAASNRDIKELVANGTFRSDLFYRLNVVPIDIPPLRERSDDLFPLVQHILAQLSRRYRTGAKHLGPRARDKVRRYHWPGNIRELENLLERAFIFSPGAVIEELDVEPAPMTEQAGEDWREHKRRVAQQAEAEHLISTLRRFRGNVSQVAQELGITARAVRMKLKAHALTAANFR
jgi:DNA-binding NtrC family response regulator